MWSWMTETYAPMPSAILPVQVPHLEAASCSADCRRSCSAMQAAYQHLVLQRM